MKSSVWGARRGLEASMSEPVCVCVRKGRVGLGSERGGALGKIYGHQAPRSSPAGPCCTHTQHSASSTVAPLSPRNKETSLSTGTRSRQNVHGLVHYSGHASTTQDVQAAV